MLKCSQIMSKKKKPNGKEREFLEVIERIQNKKQDVACLASIKARLAQIKQTKCLAMLPKTYSNSSSLLRAHNSGWW